MSSINAEIKKVTKVLSQNLSIPYYQRPYRWQEKNVNQLLEDIYTSWKNVKSAYRIGSVILHNKSEKEIDIIDGQQRITTLVLILHVLDADKSILLLRRFNYAHKASIENIKRNHLFIKSWVIENLPNEEAEFYNYITKFCEFVEITVAKDELSQAFQMFDSQNTRGKHLEPYNLLKAYHLRAMEGNSQEEKILCDRRWENATRYVINPLDNENPRDLLKQLFNEQLYRTRVWSKKYPAYHFSKNHIEEFKGQFINSKNGVEHPFLNKDLMHTIALNYFESLNLNVKGVKSRLNNRSLQGIVDYVSINQAIINGKAFFDYISSYVEMYKLLFILDEIPKAIKEFRDFYNTFCHYTGSNRTGDQYLLELYKSAMMMVFDKYGEDGILKNYKTIYAIIYRLRLEKWQVRYVAVAKYPSDNNLFAIIEESKNYFDLRVLNHLANVNVEKQRHIPKIEEVLTQLGVQIIDKVK